MKPLNIGMDKCCTWLKTQGLLNAIKKHKFDAAFEGARREGKSPEQRKAFSLSGMNLDRGIPNIRGIKEWRSIE